MKTNTNKPSRALWRFLQCFVLLAFLTGCEVRDNSCTHKEGHKWNKWEPTPKPAHYFDGAICTKRTCEHCGLVEARSIMP